MDGYYPLDSINEYIYIYIYIYVYILYDYYNNIYKHACIAAALGNIEIIFI